MSSRGFGQNELRQLNWVIQKAFSPPSFPHVTAIEFIYWGKGVQIVKELQNYIFVQQCDVYSKTPSLVFCILFDSPKKYIKRSIESCFEKILGRSDLPFGLLPNHKARKCGP
jgi:hypothetical protein